MSLNFLFGFSDDPDLLDPCDSTLESDSDGSDEVRLRLGGGKAIQKYLKAQLEKKSYSSFSKVSGGELQACLWSVRYTDE